MGRRTGWAEFFRQKIKFMAVKEKFLRFFLLSGDIFSLYFSLFLALLIRRHNFSFLVWQDIKIFLWNFSVFYIFWLFFLLIFDFYEISFLKRLTDFFYNLTLFFIFAFASGMAYFYFQPQIIFQPKTILFLNVLMFSAFVALWRMLFFYILKSFGIRQKIAIVGFNGEFGKIIEEPFFKNYYKVLAFFDPKQNSLGKLSGNLVKYGFISDINSFNKIIKKEKINFLVFSSSAYQDKNLRWQIISGLPADIKHINFIDFYESLTKKIPLFELDETWFFQNFQKPQKKIETFIKRTLDIFFSVLGLIITAVLFPFIALGIRIESSGKIFYNQKRVGRAGEIFTFYKFRTMVETKDQDKKLWREKSGGEVTKFGRFLRRLHIDEFPQFWNILKGDLSFVGPRPEWLQLAKIFEKEIPFYKQRYLVRPGFTGWAQINFPASTSIEEAKEKFEYDLYYIKNQSFFFDIMIILKTFKIIFW